MKIIDDACGRYTLHQTPAQLAKRYNVAKAPADIRENYNVAPGQIMPVVVEEDGKTTIELMKWGLIPSWSKDPKIGYRLINARDDTIFEKPVWRSVILKKRCLIPADGFYEWQKIEENAGAKKHKQPFYIHPKQTGIFSFAGVWESWKDAEDKEWKTYSIVTTEPNKEMRDIHNRMPVILPPEDESSWLDVSRTKREQVEPFLLPYHDNGLEVYKVTQDVNSTANNSKHLIAALN
jgi:putative SOS response-associated peptidase YedK